ncbi:ABC transporter permease [Mesorhizobium sp. WSM4887]|uniref:ABC transporter permease n=1 Tax=Mesorhizobium sp. WSM4887 TaxID=3038543 RepID=UPI002417D7D3|nr:ABC transporter permease [Mesorhizobium sp. WSM4887]MDG4889785.1 ABC transporter permease [Mesorhizobium sp. WSM4887]
MDIVVFLRRRLLQVLPVLFGIVLAVFLSVRLIPGDPARIMLGVHASDEKVAALREQMGLDQPLLWQFGKFVANVAQGELGTSLVYRRGVSQVIFERLPVTSSLIAYAVMLSILLCVPLATIAAVRQGKTMDYLVRGVSTLTLSMPGFWLGLNLLIMLAVTYPLFPVSGYGRNFGDRVWHLFLPALTIAFSLAPMLIRSLRDAVIEVLNSPHVEFARTKGLSEWNLLRRHVLRNGLLSTVTILGVNIGWLMGGSVIVETVFTIPGTGSLIVSSIFARDYPMIQGIALVFGAMVIVINLLTDIVYALLDPRVSYE